MIGLARFLAKPTPQAAPGERCEFCTVPIEPDHSHLVDVAERRLLCSCRPCYLLFTPEGAAGGRYKAVPSRYVHLDDLSMTEQQWDALQLPIRLAFFFHSSQAAKMVAFYPSPAGATESLLPLDAWEEIAKTEARIGTLTPDVEAVLLHRLRSGEQHCYLVPIDACYELVGLIRSKWKGFDGGEEALDAISRFFERVDARSKGMQLERRS